MHFSFSKFCPCFHSRTKSEPKSYNAILKKNEFDADKAIALLNDYANPRGGLFFSLHWNRHHVTTVRKTLSDLKADDMLKSGITAQLVLSTLKKNLVAEGKDLKKTGSLFRRLSFIQSKFFNNVDFTSINTPAIKRSSSNSW